jgi:hypothetical protein
MFLRTTSPRSASQADSTAVFSIFLTIEASTAVFLCSLLLVSVRDYPPPYLYPRQPVLMRESPPPHLRYTSPGVIILPALVCYSTTMPVF